MSKTAKINKNSKSTKVAYTEADLQKLTHTGTKEAIAKLEAYIKSEKEPNKKAYAEMALEECELFYYEPGNEKEEREFMLCKLTNDHEQRIEDLEMEKEKNEAKLEKYKLEQDVHKKVLTDHKNKKKDWEYYGMDFFAENNMNRIDEVDDQIAYEKAWVNAARKMITTKRYKDGISERHLSHYDFGFDDEYVDDENFGCCDDGCSNCDSTDDDLQMVDDIPY